MQNWSGCNELGTEETITLRDIRDDNDYTIAKLKDGKCWMTQDIRLSGTSGIELNSDNSNISSNFSLPASNLDEWVYDNNTAYNYLDSNTGRAYYSYTAATAGKRSFSNDLYSISMESICPKGWHLPFKQEYETLQNYYDQNSLQQAPASFTIGGQINNMTIANTDYAHYWTSSKQNNSPYYFYFTNSQNPYTSTASFYYGKLVRCVSGTLTNKSYTINYNLESGTYVYGSLLGEKNDSPQSGTAAYSIKIGKYKPYRKNYIFDGWCTQKPSGTSCPGTKYNAEQEIELTQPNITLDLYAIYKSAPYPDITDVRCSSVDRSTVATYNNRNITIYKYNGLCSDEVSNHLYQDTRPTWEQSASICPSGWHRPTMSEYRIFNTNGNSTSPNTWVSDSSGTNAYYCSGCAYSGYNSLNCTLIPKTQQNSSRCYANS